VLVSGKHSLPEQYVGESLALFLPCSFYAQTGNAASSLLFLLCHVLEGGIIMFCWVGPNCLLRFPNRTKTQESPLAKYRSTSTVRMRGQINDPNMLSLKLRTLTVLST